MNHLTPATKQRTLPSPRKPSAWLALLTGILILNFSGLAQADNLDSKKVRSSWRAEGQVYSMNTKSEFYSGLMKGTFFVKDHTGKTHYMHSTQMTCPFSVFINKGGKDELQGMCQLANSNGDQANAKIFCIGEKENCLGTWSFTSGTGNLRGIKGGGKMKIRVDLVKKDSTGYFGNKMGASGYLVINDLHDNVDSTKETPRVR